MATSRRNTSQRLTLVILLLASITIITLDYRGEARSAITSTRNAVADALSPVQQAVATVLHPIGNLFSGAVNYGGVLNENQRLQYEVGQLRLQVAQSRFAQQQLQEILATQHLPFSGGIPQVLGRVISAPSSNFQLTIEIDRGTSSGVGIGMPVVSGAGLIGTVVAAGKSTSTIRLITDPLSSVGVRYGTNAVAVADGQGRGDALNLRFVTSTAAPHLGEPVVTSGLNPAALPSGIPVGTVSSVRHSGGAITSQVLVDPAVNLDNLQYVAVLQWFPPA